MDTKTRKGFPPVTPEQVAAALRHAGNLHHQGPHYELTGEELRLIRSYAPEYTLSVCTARILACSLCDVLGLGDKEISLEAVEAALRPDEDGGAS